MFLCYNLGMDFNEYQRLAKRTDLDEPGATDQVMYPGFMDMILGLSGEAGEFTDKVKKIVRDKEGKISSEDREELLKELGDVLWYVALVAEYMGVPMEEVAKKNIEKLASRQKRGTLTGSGDNR